MRGSTGAFTFGEHENGDQYRQTTLVHLNGNLLCSVDVKTTGMNSTEHEIYEIGIFPVDSFLNRRKDKIPLDLLIKPNYPDKIDWNYLEKVNCKVTIEKANIEGHPQHVAIRLFERWVADLELPVRKKIAPIGYNYGHEGRFLRQWIGNLSYGTMFDDSNIRDIRVIAKFLNDLADLRGAPYPFKKIELSSIALKLNVFTDYGRTRSALHDAAITADVYKRMLDMIRKEVII
jgi:DNA polymerase III epsilon subunit-like protein